MEMLRVIQLDHCYTSQTSPNDPKPTDPLPLADSPDMEDSNFSQMTENVAQIVTVLQSAGAPETPSSVAKPKIVNTRSVNIY